MWDADRAGAGAAYLEHLTDDDLALLGGVGPRLGLGALDAARLRSRPDLVERLVASPAAFEAAFGPAALREPFLRVSPALTFALAVHRSAEELRGAASVSEWVGPRRALPVFDADALRDFLADPFRRLFLVELLASYTHVASGSVWVHTRRGWRRRRFSELDPVRLASLLEAVPDDERAGVYRRLGDLALFLTGVFPDATATRALGPVDEARLRRVGREDRAEPLPLSAAPEGLGPSGAVGLFEALGVRWYRLACATAPKPLTASVRVVEDVAGRFSHARRILNHVTSRHLFPFRGEWFSAPGR